MSDSSELLKSVIAPVECFVWADGDNTFLVEDEQRSNTQYIVHDMGKKDQSGSSIVLSKSGIYKYLFVVIWSQANIDIRIEGRDIDLTVAVLAMPQKKEIMPSLSSIDSEEKSIAKKQASAADFVVTIAWSSSKASVSMVSFLTNSTSSTVNWKIDLAAGVQDAEWYLSEEIVVLGEKIKVKASPQLFVWSHNVKATHWASIQRLDPNKLFYMNAKGVNNEQAKKMMISGYIAKTLAFVWIEDENVVKNRENMFF